MPEPTGKFAERAQRHHVQVHRLLADGHSIRAIARHLGWGRHTVQRYAHATTWQQMVHGRWKGPRPSKLDPFKSHLEQRLQQGRPTIAALHREITVLGHTGSYANLGDYLRRRRPARDPPVPAPPSVRQVTGWLTRPPDTLNEDERPRLKAISDRCEPLAEADRLVRAFGEMLTHLTGQHLPQWIDQASAAAGLPGLTPFTRGLDLDFDAVQQGLSRRHNSGPVNHIKMLKRQM
ncbi:helix-turn-helix domain-containing protein [Spirillospora sp. NPDC127200]